MTDEEIIQSIKAGDQSHFKYIIERYNTLVHSTVTHMLGINETAEDIVQNVFIRLFNHLDQFKGNSKLSTYITRIAINLSLNEIKRKKRRTFLSLFTKEDQLIPIQDESDKTEVYDTKELISKGLYALDEKYRAVIVLRLIEEYSTKETAEILQLPEGTVLSRLARGQEQLRNVLKKLMEVNV
mgnify:CR=1 FL=1